MRTAASESASPLPADLQAVLDDLANAETQAGRLVAGLTDAQLNWQPDGGTAWSISQGLDHLAKTNAAYAAALREAVAKPHSSSTSTRTPIQPGWLERYFIKSMDAPARRRFKAPKTVIPVLRISGDEALKAFVSSHDAIRALLLECRSVDLNRIRFKNPFVPLIRFTVAAGLLIVAAHDRRHLWQAGQVRSAMECGRQTADL